MLRNTAGQKLTVYAYTIATAVAKTGDAANITGYYRLSDGTVTVLSDTNPDEVDATNMKGYYTFTLSQAETNADKVSFSSVSGSAGVAVSVVPSAVVYTRDAYRVNRLDFGASERFPGRAWWVDPDNNSGVASNSNVGSAALPLISLAGVGAADFSGDRIYLLGENTAAYNLPIGCALYGQGPAISIISSASANALTVAQNSDVYGIGAVATANSASSIGISVTGSNNRFFYGATAGRFDGFRAPNVSNILFDHYDIAGMWDGGNFGGSINCAIKHSRLLTDSTYNSGGQDTRALLLDDSSIVTIEDSILIATRNDSTAFDTCGIQGAPKHLGMKNVTIVVTVTPAGNTGSAIGIDDDGAVAGTKSVIINGIVYRVTHATSSRQFNIRNTAASGDFVDLGSNLDPDEVSGVGPTSLFDGRYIFRYAAGGMIPQLRD